MTYQNYTAWASVPLTGEPELSVVIPAYNESARIVPTIAGIAGYLCSHDLSWELIVADDGSSDGTANLVERLGLANCRVLRSPENRGKGDAVRRGLRAAAGRYVLFTDADLSTPIEEVAHLLEILRRGDAKVAIGSRAAAGADEAARSRVRSLLSRVLRLILGIAFPIGVLDSQCGFKLFRRDVARQLADLQTIDGFSFDLELLWIAERLGYRIHEQPVQWVDAPGSTVNPSREAVRFLRDMVLIRRRHRRTAAPRPLHVGVVSPHPPSKQTLNEYGYHLVRHLCVKAGVGTVTLFCDEHELGIPQPHPKVDVVPCWRFDAVSNPARIVGAVRRAKPDVVLFNLQFASFGARKIPAALGLFAPLLLRLFGIKTVVLLHNLVDTVDLERAGFAKNPLVSRILTLIGRLLTRVVLCADRVAVTIPAYVEILRSRYGATNVYLAPHGSFGEPRDVDLELPDRPRILAFGKFGTYKRVETLIEAYRVLRDRGHDVELEIAGSDSPNSPGYLEGVAASNRDLPDLSFTGYVPEEAVPTVFESATMVVFPYTATTGSSGPLHQAGEFGRAAVLPRIGDLLEVVEEEGFTGEPFEPTDATSLADAIERLLTDRDRLLANAGTNAAAARGLPMSDVVDWHLLHLGALQAAA